LQIDGAQVVRGNRRRRRLRQEHGCYEAIRALEDAGLLTWVNRLVRVREACADLFGKTTGSRWRVVRTCNAYVLRDPLFRHRLPARLAVVPFGTAMA
jgi:hypothetical protein